jgi:two-component system, LytTR family, sensor kinase
MQYMDAIPEVSKARWYSWIVSIWFSIALFDAAQTVFVMHSEGMQHPWVRVFVTTFLSWAPWAVVSPVVLRLGRRYPPSHLKLFSWFVHLSLWAVLNFLYAAWMAILEELLNPWAISADARPFVPLWLDKWYNGLLQSLFLYAALLTISHLLESRKQLVHQQVETARLNAQLSRAQFDALRRQIEPHFLFNTLNAIAGLVRQRQNEAAVTMIAGVSEFLRRVTEDASRQEVPLQEEMEVLEKYLDIQKMRFTDCLQLSVSVPQDLLPVPVPSLILQPMVENAVKHGIARRIRGGSIRITASRSNSHLTIRVYNDGPPLPEGWHKTRSGVGVSNVRARLQSLYRDDFEFSLRNQGQGVEALLSIPLKRTQP